MANTKSIGIAYSDQAIVSGSVDSTPIGAGGASTGAFTSVTASSASVSGAAAVLTGTAPAAAAATPVGLKFSSTANLGLFFGTGAPSGTVSAAKGSLYINTTATTTTSRLYINTDGATTWATFNTSA